VSKLWNLYLDWGTKHDFLGPLSLTMLLLIGFLVISWVIRGLGNPLCGCESCKKWRSNQ